MGVDDGVPIHYSLAEIQVRVTDLLHRTHEHENVGIDIDKWPKNKMQKERKLEEIRSFRLSFED